MLLMPLSCSVLKSPELLYDFTGNKLKVRGKWGDCIKKTITKEVALTFVPQQRLERLFWPIALKLTTINLSII